ncbi:hypothetical protein Tco_1526254 [Tanacetum coccineum]
MIVADPCPIRDPLRPLLKARLIYGEESGIKIRSREESHYSESKTPTVRTEPRRRHEDRYSRSPSPHASIFKRLKKNRSPSPRPRPRKEGGVFNRLGRKEPATSARSDSRQRSPQAKRTEVEARRRQQKGTSRTTSQYSESEVSEGGHWKSKSRRQRSNTYEDDLSQPWTCEERNPFTLRIRHFSLPRTRMPSHVKTYDGSGDPEDHLKLFQSAAKTKGWAMPTWCHMFNSTLTGNYRVWFDKLPKESIDSYEDLRTAFRENYLQQTKHIKDPVEKLVDAGIMKEVHYHSWLSNPVMVKKHDGTWRMCVDFKDLNTACPKDCYPLPEID